MFLIVQPSLYPYWSDIINIKCAIPTVLRTGLTGPSSESNESQLIYNINQTQITRRININTNIF